MRPCIWRLLLLAVCLFVAGCGSSRPPSDAVASVAGATITRSDVARYLAYTKSYYGRIAPGSCAARGCGDVRRQILARLIEERVVLAYAARRHISLSAEDRMKIGAQLAHLSVPPGARAVADVGAPFIRSVLTRQALIQDVERAVTPARLLRGPSVHLLAYVIPAGTDRRAYAQALALATNGKPVPPSAREKYEWVAAFHVPSWMDSAVAGASPGQYLGPFRRHDQLLVYRVLGHGTHRYSAPARAVVEVRYFSRWLKRELAREIPSCYGPSGNSRPCPGPR